MSVRALVGIVAEWWTPESETEPDADGHIAERPASFYLHPLTGPEMMEVQDFFDLENRTVKSGGLLRACRLGLRDWRNVLDENDNELSFDPSLNTLPAEWIASAGSQIISNSVVSEETEKN